MRIRQRDIVSESTTIRVQRETRDRLNLLARGRGISTPELVRQLVERAEDDELFVQHANAYDELRRALPSSLNAIEREDAAWEASDLAAPPGAG